MNYTHYQRAITKDRVRLALFLMAAVFALTVVLTTALQAGATDTNKITVTGDTSAGYNQPGWLFNRDATAPYEFNTDEASIGTGSLYAGPISSTPSDKFIGENFINTAVADVEDISYDFLIGSGGSTSDANQFYMNVYANFGESDDGKFYDCRYSIVPTSGSTTSFTTVTFDPSASYAVTKRGSSPHSCPASPADMDNVSPGSNIRAFTLNVGDTSDSDAGVDGYLDNVVVNVDSHTTIYDFEAAPANKRECKKGGYTDFGFSNQGQCIRYANTGKDSR